eukprot:9344995-Pyramimonas_sp.AAC.1
MEMICRQIIFRSEIPWSVAGRSRVGRGSVADRSRIGRGSVANDEFSTSVAGRPRMVATDGRIAATGRYRSLLDLFGMGPGTGGRP